MEPRDKQTIDTMTEDISRLKRLILIMERRIKALEKENIRIKHDVRTTKSAVQTVASRVQPGRSS
jgi:hypothetical protein